MLHVMESDVDYMAHTRNSEFLLDINCFVAGINLSCVFVAVSMPVCVYMCVSLCVSQGSICEWQNKSSE